MIPDCPHCGSESGIVRNVRLYGWAQQYFDKTGEYAEMDVDRMNHTSTKTLRCPDCNKIRRDVILVGLVVVRAK